MASKYIKKFKVPNGFENILSDFAKEILRNQPKDILQFGIEYFQGLETNTKIDYTGKGENRPDKYQRPENQPSNIINAPNNLEMSHEDKNRHQRSMDKISRINGEPVPEREYGGPHGGPDTEHQQHGPHGGPDTEHQQRGPDFEHEQHGGPGFRGEIDIHHGEQNEYERGRHIAKYETEEHHERRIEQGGEEGHRFVMREETHVTKQVTVIKNGQVVKEESSSHQFIKKFDDRQNLPGEGGHPPGRYNNLDEQEREENKPEYGEWFTKHSMDKQAIDYKPEEEKLDENLKRNEVGYNTWFNNHSGKKENKNEREEKDEVQDNNKVEDNNQIEESNQIEDNKNIDENRKIDDNKKTPQKGKDGYDDWFTKHSIDKSAVEYKPEEEKLDENLKRTEVGYNTWFKNHSVRSIDQSQSDEILNGERPKVEYSDWFERHSGDRMVIEYKPEEKKIEEVPRNEVDYETWFNNHSQLTNKFK